MAIGKPLMAHDHQELQQRAKAMQPCLPTHLRWRLKRPVGFQGDGLLEKDSTKETPCSHCRCPCALSLATIGGAAVRSGCVPELQTVRFRVLGRRFVCENEDN